MRIYATRLVIGLLFSLVACETTGPTRSELEARAYTVALDSLYADTPARVLVVERRHADPLLWLDRDTGAPRPDTAAARRELERQGVASSLAADFVMANARPDSVRQLFVAKLPVVFDTLPPLSRAQYDSLLRIARPGLGFERVRRAYPGATQLLRVSRVGISPDLRHGLVYIESGCGMLCGGGALIRLSRERDQWRIASYDWLWVS